MNNPIPKTKNEKLIFFFVLDSYDLFNFLLVVPKELVTRT